jgi:hypothetical protein
MEIATEPEMYSPSINSRGEYVDKRPMCFSTASKGIRCPCGSRKDKVYDPGHFSAHMNTKTHQKWIAELNLNRANFYAENEDLRRTIASQRMIIAKMEVDLQNKNMTVDFLTQQLVSKNAQQQKTENLLDIMD